MAYKPRVQYVQFYTHGSAAHKIQQINSAPSDTVLPAPRKIKRKAVYVDPVAILGIIVAVSMLIMMAVGIAEYVSVSRETAMLEQYVDELSQENHQLSLSYREGYDLETIEKTALALGMIPAEQAQRVQIQVSTPRDPAQQVTLWEQISTFLTGLFA